MPRFEDDNRLILTLDVGGTNLAFSAFKAGLEVVKPFSIPTEAHDLEVSLKQITDGFKSMLSELKQEKPSAISFSFPGPADYALGIIDNEGGNLPAYKGGVALGAYLENIFKVPVFINNDGDLFTCGEAMFGLLKEVNSRLVNRAAYRNLIGVTLGTGFGGGFVSEGKLLRGDTSNGLEIWTMRNGVDHRVYAEEGISKRAIVNYYGDHSLSPFDIYKIAKGETKGNQEKAKKSFEHFGETLGEALANLVTILDGLVVIGGGLARSRELFMPKVMEVLRGKIESFSGKSKERIVQHCYNLDDPKDCEIFFQNDVKKIPVLGTDKFIDYNPTKKIGIGFCKQGTNHAVQLGAYAYAIEELNRRKL